VTLVVGASSLPLGTAPELLDRQLRGTAPRGRKGKAMTDWTNPVTFPINVVNLALGVATVGLCGVYAWAILTDWISHLRRH